MHGAMDTISTLDTISTYQAMVVFRGASILTSILMHQLISRPLHMQAEIKPQNNKQVLVYSTSAAGFMFQSVAVAIVCHDVGKDTTLLSVSINCNQQLDPYCIKTSMIYLNKKQFFFIVQW